MLPAQGLRGPCALPQCLGLARWSIDVGGRRVAYVDEGSGPPVLLLHGAPFTSLGFVRVIRSLRAHHRTAVAFTTARYDDAVERYRAAADMLERHHGADAPQLSPVLANLGHAQHRAGSPHDGVRALERALSLLVDPTDPLVEASINLYLADALADADRSRDARRAAERAKAAYATLPDRSGRYGVDEVERWLAAHPARP